MKKSKIFKLTAVILCGLMCVTMFSACGNKKEIEENEDNVAIADPNFTISEKTNNNEENKNEENEEEVKKENDKKIKDKSYYLSLKNTKKEEFPFNYNGSFMIDGIKYASDCTLKRFAEKHEDVNKVEELSINPNKTLNVNWKTRKEGTTLIFKNKSNVAVLAPETTISRFKVTFDADTKLYDIIGQQPKKISDDMDFIDSVIHVLGIPDSITDSGENMINLYYMYEQQSISITVNPSTQKGYIEISYN